jgi:hypothetical protein
MDPMDISTLKKTIIQKIDQANENQLLEVLSVFSEDISSDWWEEVPDEVKDAIQLSLKQSESGQVIEHDKVVKDFAPWLAK